MLLAGARRGCYQKGSSSHLRLVCLPDLSIGHRLIGQSIHLPACLPACLLPADLRTSLPACGTCLRFHVHSPVTWSELTEVCSRALFEPLSRFRIRGLAMTLIPCRPVCLHVQFISQIYEIAHGRRFWNMELCEPRPWFSALISGG